VAAYSSASHCTKATAGVYLAPADLVADGIEGAGQGALG
jgi:hypothetical protein